MNKALAEHFESDQPSSDEIPTLSSLWLADAQAMKPDAWQRLADTFGPIVYRWCRSAGVNEKDSADVVQEVFVAVARAIPKFKRELARGSFRSWLATITRNKVRDHFRQQNSRDVARGGTDALQQLEQQADLIDCSSISDINMTPTIQAAMERASSEFEPRTWEAFWLTTVENRPASVVAELLEYSVASVYQAKSRVLRRLRELIPNDH